MGVEKVWQTRFQQPRQDSVKYLTGLSGLAAAHRLKDAGREVIVLEAGSRPGGRCQVIEKDGFTIEFGPDLTSEVMSAISRLWTSWV